MLANGNRLLEGLPGLANTRAVKAIARNLDAGLSRIQLEAEGTVTVPGIDIYWFDPEAEVLHTESLESVELEIAAGVPVENEVAADVLKRRCRPAAAVHS